MPLHQLWRHCAPERAMGVTGKHPIELDGEQVVKFKGMDFAELIAPVSTCIFLAVTTSWRLESRTRTNCNVQHPFRPSMFDECLMHLN